MRRCRLSKRDIFVGGEEVVFWKQQWGIGGIPGLSWPWAVWEMRD